LKPKMLPAGAGSADIGGRGSLCHGLWG
jgi:hypothetical protein